MSLSDILHSGEKNLLHSSMTVGRLPKRRIPTFVGSQYGTLDTLIVASAGDTLEIIFATASAGVAHFLCDGDSASNRAYIYFSAADKIVWDTAEITALTIDGVAATSGVTAAPNDGKIHTIIATLSAGTKLSTIGADYVTNQDYHGQILSVKYTDKSGASDVITNFVFDSGSTTDQPSRGGGNNITLVNFATPDWTRYTLQQNITHDAGVVGEAWVGDDFVINGRFSADTGWVLGAEWSISSGKLNRAVAAATSTSQASIIHQSSPHILKYNVDKVGGDNSSVFLGGALFKDTPDSGDFIILNTVGTSANIVLLTDANFEGSFDNISVQHILEVA